MLITVIRPSSFGWEQVTSSEIATRRRSTQSCRPPILWTISESILTQNWLWSVRLANFVKFAISTCVAYARCVDRSRRNAYARWFMLSSPVEWIIATASFTVRIHIFSTGLQSVLDSAARLVLNIAKFSGISAAIRDELHWLPIRKRIEFKIVLLVRHCLVGAAPEYLIELCRPVSSAAGRQSLRSASRGDLVIPRFRLQTFGSRAFAISGPQLWNSLPLDVRQSRDNLLQFKMKLKTFLFQQFWALLWILSNEGPYKCSILLLLLLLLHSPDGRPCCSCSI